MPEPAVNPQPIRKQWPGGPRRAINRLSPLTQALDLRDSTFKRLQSEELTPEQHSRLTRAWTELCTIVRELQGHGKPRPVTARNDPDRKPAKVKLGVLPQPIDEG